MLYSEKKEREHKFILALRMGLPIFFVSVIAISTLLISDSSMIISFIILSLILLSVMIYFIFYLIDQGSKEKIIDSISKTFTFKYFTDLINKKYKHKNFSLMMITIDNLSFINEHYGAKNGDKILYKVVKIISYFLNEKNINNIAITRYKGGDFLIVLNGDKTKYIHLLELFLSKYQSYIINEIECRISAVIVDSKISNDIELLTDRLYDLRRCKVESSDDEESLSKLESDILDALENRRFSIGFWSINDDKSHIYEISVKLLDLNNKLIHQTKYIPILNRLNKTREFESIILEKIAQLCELTDAKFMINISAVTLRNPYFFEYSMMILQKYPQAIDKIIFIFEDRDYCHKMEKFNEQIRYYRNSGYKIALDRLGVSQTTLLYLKDIDIDYVRFDTSYSKNLKNQKYQNLILGFNITTKSLNIKTIMPLIEDIESNEIAKSLNIDYMQGKYYGDLVTLENLIA